VCKVCDFGWAAICEDRRLTYCGTLDYVCPEIVEGNSYNSGVDVWCIGVLAYEMMCGKAPFYDISRRRTI
jgi:aurora kinase